MFTAFSLIVLVFARKNSKKKKIISINRTQMPRVSEYICLNYYLKKKKNRYVTWIYFENVIRKKNYTGPVILVHKLFTTNFKCLKQKM